MKMGTCFKAGLASMRQDTGCKDDEHLKTFCTRGEIIGYSHLVQIST